MPEFYVVKDIGGGFDGLVVEGLPSVGMIPLISISRIIDRTSIVGDRNVSLHLPDGAVYIHPKFLEKTDDPGTREFAANNPFGKMVLEGHMEVGDIKVSYAQFESVLSVNVRDESVKKTIFSQYFSKDFDKVKKTIEDVLKDTDSDVEDLVFQLRAIKEAETNG